MNLKKSVVLLSAAFLLFSPPLAEASTVDSGWLSKKSAYSFLRSLKMNGYVPVKIRCRLNGPNSSRLEVRLIGKPIPSTYRHPAYKRAVRLGQEIDIDYRGPGQWSKPPKKGYKKIDTTDYVVVPGLGRWRLIVCTIPTPLLP